MARKPNSSAGIRSGSKCGSRVGSSSAGTSRNGTPMILVGGKWRPAGHTTIHHTGFLQELNYSLSRGEFPKKLGESFLITLREKGTITTQNGKNSVNVKRCSGETGFLIEIELIVSGKREVRIYNAETGKYLLTKIGEK